MQNRRLHKVSYEDAQHYIYKTVHKVMSVDESDDFWLV